jgi:integrase
MRGSIKQRYKGSWSIIIDLGNQPDPTTCKPRRKQTWITFRGTMAEAEKKLAEYITAAHAGTLAEPSKVTVHQWLSAWLKTLHNASPATVTRYTGIVDQHIGPSMLGALPLQKVRALHLDAYYTEKRSTLAASTLTIHHVVLAQAFDTAVRDRLMVFNPAQTVGSQQKPKRSKERNGEIAKEHCWTLEETRRFLGAARAAGPQPAAFYTLALDSGMRKGELCGLKWSDLDLATGKIQVNRQLLTPGPSPVYGPTKTKAARTITVSPETLELLKAHKQHQAELKMANRTRYHDLGLVFAKEWSDLGTSRDSLGHPLQKNNLGEREFARIVRAAEVRRIKFHGMRHTCATLLLANGEALQTVAQRLGHAQTSTTLNTYAHATEDLQKSAAATMGRLLHASVS